MSNANANEMRDDLDSPCCTEPVKATSNRVSARSLIHGGQSLVYQISRSSYNEAQSAQCDWQTCTCFSFYCLLASKNFRNCVTTRQSDQTIETARPNDLGSGEIMICTGMGLQCTSPWSTHGDICLP